MNVMRLRTRHLACLILLLSALSGAEGSTPRHGDYTLGGHYIGVLLAHDQASTTTVAALSLRPRDAATLDLPTAQLARHRTIWTMRPAAAHSVSLHEVTGSGL